MKDPKHPKNQTPQKILGTELRNISERSAPNLPSLKAPRRNVRKARQDMRKSCSARSSLCTVCKKSQVTASNEQLLIFHSGIGDTEILFFASETGIQFLADSEHWDADGTFKVSSELFLQLYKIHLQKERQHIFLCFSFITKLNGSNVFENLSAGSHSSKPRRQ